MVRMIDRVFMWFAYITLQSSTEDGIVRAVTLQYSGVGPERNNPAENFALYLLWLL